MLTVIPYAVAVIFVWGILSRFIIWLSSPNPLKIPTTPAPKTFSGVVARIAGEVVLFQSLFKADKKLWLGGWIFHVSFLLIVLRHLRYFLYPVPEWVMVFQTMGIYAGFTLVLALAYLLIRRLTIDRVNYVSSFMDYAVLLLLMLIGITGLTMKFIGRPNLVDIKAYILGLFSLSPEAMPDSTVFILHLLLFLLLLLYFPFSKLLHAGGVFISPTKTQTDTPVEKRHITPWAK